MRADDDPDVGSSPSMAVAGGDIPRQRESSSRAWVVPAPLAGDSRLIRIGAGLVVDELAGCPEHLAAKARPRVQARRRLRYGIDDVFALDPVMTALDRVEHEGISPARVAADINADPAVPEALRGFTAHAVEQGLRPAAGSPALWFWMPCRLQEKRLTLFTRSMT